MNVFTMPFEQRLSEWSTLRQTLVDTTLEKMCVDVDAFWQHCPLNAYYLHIHDMKVWPGPWQLLHDNTYCYYARALGIIYTLLLLGIKDVDLLSATDYNNVDVVLVVVDNAKYVLNYWPQSVLNTRLDTFTNIKKIDINELLTKIK
tara:strand:+ start:94 stop:531 length:438 start_codon:yes stop_codon:yes gene_type:complete